MGVFDGKSGFIGIRKKFESHYLATEYHWDQGPPHGTARPVRDIGVDAPPDVVLSDSGGTIDDITGRTIVQDDTIDNPNEGFENKKGWWKFVDTGEPCGPVGKMSAVALSNRKLEKFLGKVERAQGKRRS